MELSPRGRMVLRIAILITVCTLVLTTSFIGVIAALAGDVGNIEARMPLYLLAAATVFVATIVLLEFHGSDGKTIILAALFTGAISFVLLVLSVEGIRFAIINPERVFVNQLILYFIAAALVATGIGFWGLNHWREFTDDRASSL